MSKACNLKIEEGTSMEVHIDKFCMVIDQLANIDCPICCKYLTFTFLSSLPPFVHTLTILLNTYTDELSMELIHGQLLQKELQSKSKVFSHCTRQETLTIRDLF
jgi:hypothetical protein